jgi:hypothetical protein
MASVLRLQRPLLGMDRMLNVSQRVGPLNCPSDPGDVEAVQRLLNLCARNTAARLGFALPQPTGQFDPVTAFFIFYIQWYSHKDNPGTVIDGVVSPATGAFYGPGPFVITNMNILARRTDQAAWDNLLSRYPVSP